MRMNAAEWIRFIVGCLFILIGMVIFFTELFGVFHFKYVLNRMHAAAMGDTLGIASSLIGLILFSGLNFTSLKLFCIIVFLWFSSPTSSHLIARLEVVTDEKKEKHYTVMNLDKPEERQKEDAKSGNTEAGSAGGE